MKIGQRVKKNVNGTTLYGVVANASKNGWITVDWKTSNGKRYEALHKSMVQRA